MDRSEFEQLVRENWPLVRSVARRFGRGPDVEDICQDVVLVAWRRRDALADPAAFGAWVRAIALNVGRAHTRRRETRFGPSAEEVAADADIAQQVADGDALAEALAALSKRERLAVEAHHVMGWPLGDIAAALDEPVGTAKARLSRARGKLRRELRHQGWTRYGRTDEEEADHE
jgi:RNA polymerase sigma-70 factor (ECF subfamily)